MKAQIVSFHCVLKNKLGQVLGSSFNQDVINQLDEATSKHGGQRLRGLVAGIQNVHQGEKRQFSVPAHEAYGPYDPDLLLNVRRSDLSQEESLEIGSEIMSLPTRTGEKRAFRVVSVTGDTVVLDGNHPFAGQDLIFDIEVISARDAEREDYEDDTTLAPTSYTLH